MFDQLLARANENITEWMTSSYAGYRLGSLLRSTQDLYLIFIISVPLSLMLYLIFSKYRHWILVDLGYVKWLIK